MLDSPKLRFGELVRSGLEGGSLKPRGTFDLKSSRHLLDKAKHDLARLRIDPINAYAAFDLFVTLRHIPHWMR